MIRVIRFYENYFINFYVSLDSSVQEKIEYVFKIIRTVDRSIAKVDVVGLDVNRITGVDFGGADPEVAGHVSSNWVCWADGVCFCREKEEKTNEEKK